MTGNPDGPIPASSYAPFNFAIDVPSSPDTHVKAVEEKLRHHMDEMALGSPVEPDRTVRSVMAALMAMQGFKLEGEGDQAFAGLVACIQRMLVECAQAKQGSVADSDWKAKLAAMEAELKAVHEELSKAKEELALRAGGSAVSTETKHSATSEVDLLKEKEEIARLTALLLESRMQLEDYCMQVTK